MIKNFDDFRGGLNLTQSTIIKDNEFTIAKNVFYNNSKQLQTRRGYRKFGNAFGSAPATSFFFFQRDDNLERLLVAHAGTNFYKYDNTDTFVSVDDRVTEFETRPGEEGKRTRRDYAVYKNVIYMGDGVNPYAKYDGTTYTIIDTTSKGGATADHTTNTLTITTHGLENGDELYIAVSGADTMPTGLTNRQVYFVVNKTTDTFQLSNVIGGAVVAFTDNGSGTLGVFKLNQPRCRYLSYLSDSLVGAGDDTNPSTLYYTNEAPADGNNIVQNFFVIGGDEVGKINAISEYNQNPVVFKDQKIYATNIVGAPVADAIDAQTGGYSDRVIHSVGNTLVYFNERGIDILTKRTGVGDTSALESKPISDNVRDIFEKVEEKQYNANCGWYIKKMNNYYVTVDTDNDNVPDTTLVYNSTVGSWTQYTLPPLYDYGYYIDADGQYQFLFSAASGGQMFEYEYGFDDDGTDIDVEIQSKNFDFGDPAQVKSFYFMDFVGFKQEGGDIDLSVLVDGEVVGQGMITDNSINVDDVSGAIGINAIGVDSLGSTEGDENEELLLYKFTVRVQFFARGENIAFNLKSKGVQWILEKARVNVEGENKEVFYYNNIL